MITASPLSSASCGSIPTETTSGSVKTMAGIETLSNSLSSPEIISATISPCALALWASIGSPETSPIAKTPGTLVLHFLSILMNRPEASILTPVFSNPQSLVFGLLPTVTKTLSTFRVCSSPSFSNFRSTFLDAPLPFTSAPLARELVCTVTPCFFSQISRGRLNSLSNIPRMLSIPSTTVTLEPSFARAQPNSKPM